MQPVLVRSTAARHRGQRVSGVDGSRVYWCNPRTGMLHLVRSGKPAEKPGCHPDDAKEFSRFAVFKVTRNAPPAPPRGPKKPPRPPEAASSASDGESEAGEPESDPAPGEPSGASGMRAARRSELETLSSKQLKAVAQDLKVKGYGRMPKAALIEAILDAELSTNE